MSAVQPESPPFGFGIVGAGMIASFHAKAIAELDGAKLVGVADRIEERARQFAETKSVPLWTTRIEELLARPDIQAICITTPSGLHLEPALAAIRAGKHVIVEKPLEITVERIDEMLHAAESAGVRLAAIFQSRFGVGANTVKAAIDSGRFGRLVLASAYVKWHRKPEYYQGWKGTLAIDGGGALMNQGIHAVDLLQWFAGLPTEVFGWKTRCVHTGIEAEDTVSASLRFPGGALGSIEATTAAYPGWSRRIEICGENGSAALEDDKIARWDFRVSQSGDDAILHAAPDEKMRSGSGAPDQISHYGHLLQIRDLMDSVRSGRPLAVDGRAARNAVALIRAIYESADKKGPVAVR
jgi:predicted dehydrogenase